MLQRLRHAVFSNRAMEAATASAAAMRVEHERLLQEVGALRESVDRLTRNESQLRAIIGRDAEMAAWMPQLEAVLESSEVASHVRAAVDRAELRAHPYPHIVVDDLVPQRLYDALVRGLPPEALFGDRPFNSQELHVPFALAPHYSSRVWTFMSQEIVQRHLVAAIGDKFGATLDEWIGRHWPGVTWRSLKTRVSNERLLLRGRGYRIPPHRDPKWGFLVCLFYLARPGDDEAWGTQLYTVADDAEASTTMAYWIAPERCRQVADVRFVPNRLLVFLNADGAHGAGIPGDAPETARRFAYQFRIGPNASSIERLMALLPTDRQPLWARKGS